jgi:STE24 endopeptidase
MKYKYLLLLLLAGVLSFTGKAQQTNSDSTVAITNVSTSFDPVIATEQYLNTLTSEQKEKSDAYFEGGYWLSLWNFMLGLLVAWIFLSFGLSRWIKNRAEKVRNVHFQNFIYLAFYFLFSYILVFPFTIYEGFFREHSYGLSNLSFGGWLI